MDVTIAQQTNGNLRIELIGSQKTIRQALAAGGWEKAVKAAVEQWLKEEEAARQEEQKAKGRRQ